MDNYNRSYNYSHEIVDMSAAMPKLLRSVYGWMCAGLTITALSAMTLAKNYALLVAIMSNSLAFWGIIIATFGLVLVLNTCINKLSFGVATVCYAVYSMLMGVMLSSVFFTYTMTSIVSTFAISAGTFGAMSLVGFFIKKDLSTMGRMFFMLLIGIIIATVVNIFVASSGLAMILNYAGVVVFVGLTAYDTQKIKEIMQETSRYGVSENTQKVALLCSLTLYLDFINLFLHLLRILGDRK